MPYTFLIETKQSFFEWTKFNYSSINDFMKLSSKNREKVFLRWKWGLNEDASNQDLEMSRKSILHMIGEKIFADNSMNEYFNLIKTFDIKCQDIKSKIGLVREPSKLDQITAKALEAFDGELE